MTRRSSTSTSAALGESIRVVKRTHATHTDALALERRRCVGPWKKQLLSLLATRTTAVHHRCITRTPFGDLLGSVAPAGSRMVEPNASIRRAARRRIRLIGLLRENPVFAGFSHSRVALPCITRASRHWGSRSAKCPLQKMAVGQSAWLSQIAVRCPSKVASSERRLLNERAAEGGPTQAATTARPQGRLHANCPGHDRHEEIGGGDFEKRAKY